MDKWNIRIIDVGYKLERDVFIFRRIFDGKTEMLDGTIIDVGSAISKPSLSLTVEQLQTFANELNKLGISPAKEYATGKLEATEKHLKDMRALVFKKK